MSRRPNILLVVTDEGSASTCPGRPGARPPAHERLAESGTSFSNYYAAAAMCSSSRSVIYTGQHMPLTLDPRQRQHALRRPARPGARHHRNHARRRGYYTSYQGKWHLSKPLGKEPGDPSTVDALEPAGFSEWNDWGDIDGGAWAGLRVDPAGSPARWKWLREQAPVVCRGPAPGSWRSTS